MMENFEEICRFTVNYFHRNPDLSDTETTDLPLNVDEEDMI